MDLNTAFVTNVGTYSRMRKEDAGLDVVSDWLFSPFLRFLTVGAGFALCKAKLFPTEAARGGAQIVLVRRLT
jgi:hypothetical protein